MNVDINLFLASAVHDMKNSISILMNSLQGYVDKHNAEDDADLKQVSQMMSEMQRINSNLIHLLTLYKLGNDSYPFSQETHSVESFMDETISHFEAVLEAKNITVNIEMSDEIFWVFDYDLVMGVIIHALNSAISYTKDKVLIDIYEDNGYLLISVEDNGRGFPQRIIDGTKFMITDEHYGNSSNFISGSTGLGLYFSSIVASMHTNNEKYGSIELLNGGKLGGGVFRIRLP